MIKKISKYFYDNYLSLRDETDRLCQKLEHAHLPYLKCAPGCHQCCMDFSIFPVEFYSIVEEIGERDIRLNSVTSDGKCPFLTDGICSIYASRPVICRTHGLPLLYMGEEEWQLSYCELNFTSEHVPEFNESNTFPQDLFNSKLYMLNSEFISSINEKPYSERELISLSKLRERLNINGSKSSSS